MARAGALLVAVGILTQFSMGTFLLFVLFVAHLLVGAVELGTDGWIQNITGNLLTSEQGKFLFVATSVTMFALRFCVNPIERYLKLSPIGLLVGCALMACLGLSMTSTITTFEGGLAALLIYAAGKSLFWPTMRGGREVGVYHGDHVTRRSACEKNAAGPGGAVGA